MPKSKIKTSTKNIQEVSLIQKLQSELELNQSYVSLILGLLIVLVIGILIFNYLKKGQSSLGPAQQTAVEETQKDAEPDELPGKYTVKEGDTLFTIAEKYYKDGYKYSQIAQANKINDVNVIEKGQVLDIPKLEESVAVKTENGTGGAANQTIWGESITGNTYTVVEGDWLSKIAGRAYGDIMAYEKIAKASSIANPDLIEPGTLITIPR